MNNLIILSVIVVLIVGAGMLLSMSWQDFTRHVVRDLRKVKKVRLKRQTLKE